MNNLAIPDYINSINALANGPTLPGEVSFDVKWFTDGDSKRYQYFHKAEDSEPDSYAVDYWNTQATLEWQAETQGGFSFKSYKIGQYPQGRTPGQYFAISGRERNGVFAEPWPSPSSSSGAPSQSTRELAATGQAPYLPRLGVASISLGAVAGLLALRTRRTNSAKAE